MKASLTIIILATSFSLRLHSSYQNSCSFSNSIRLLTDFSKQITLNSVNVQSAQSSFQKITSSQQSTVVSFCRSASAVTQTKSASDKINGQLSTLFVKTLEQIKFDDVPGNTFFFPQSQWGNAEKEVLSKEHNLRNIVNEDLNLSTCNKRKSFMTGLLSLPMETAAKIDSNFFEKLRNNNKYE